MSKRRQSNWEDCDFYIENHPELTCIATVVRGEVILTRAGIAQLDAYRQTAAGRGDAARGSDAPEGCEMETIRHRRRREKGAKAICPECAGRRLLRGLNPAPDTLLASESRIALVGTVNEWLASLLQTMQQQDSSALVEMTARLAAPLPPALPPHITAQGLQRQLVAGHGRRWIGCARATPEELCDLKGIVIYDGAVSCFLAEDEAREVFVTLGWLLMELESQPVGNIRAAEGQQQSSERSWEQ